ncbi:low molecular weight phosphatase family protein [Streptomyces sp. MS1.AVA.4]|uniref:Low molecular weight phosphatase family protein n=1 Tax=Streptomyces pratisoli TaxID=3139917 RepID=A0ACC6QUC3_9ACTN
MSDSDSHTGAPRPPRFRVLTVCTGNIYRSPFMEQLLRAGLASQQETIHVSSAGTAAVPDSPVSDAAYSVDGWVTDVSATIPRRLTAGLIDASDLVLGASTEHREAAVRLSPVRALTRAFSLREFARLVSAEDGAGLVDPAARFTALVKGAAARRGTAGAHGDDDVADPLGASAAEVHTCVARIEESVARILAAVRAG